MLIYLRPSGSAPPNWTSWYDPEVNLLNLPVPIQCLLRTSEGLVYKKGKFSNIEEQQLDNAIENYRIVGVSFNSITVDLLFDQYPGQAKGLTHEQLLEIVFQKQDKEDKDNSFWSEISTFSYLPSCCIDTVFSTNSALAVPLRPIISVYHHVRRKRNPLQKQGKWMPAEDDKLRE